MFEAITCSLSHLPTFYFHSRPETTLSFLFEVMHLSAGTATCEKTQIQTRSLFWSAGEMRRLKASDFLYLDAQGCSHGNQRTQPCLLLTGRQRRSLASIPWPSPRRRAFHEAARSYEQHRSKTKSMSSWLSFQDTGGRNKLMISPRKTHRNILTLLSI